ncbi:diguanylate cyclase domain-containing protein [Marinicrinis lubricantis]|uniref:Diguanylate cyclase domain-containing protein n=2 Tax=Marinicrinis lubricantis TaxID=2086470 RepID=A0ABW1IN80_9BACL
MVEQLKKEMNMTSKRVEERINGMDQKELQKLELGSIVQKAYLKEMFDHITTQNDLQIYVVNPNRQIFVSSGSNELVEGTFTLFDGGYVAELDNEISVWLPEKRNHLADWSDGYYFTTMTISNLHIYCLVPIEGLLFFHLEIMILYFQATLLLFLVAVSFAFLCKRILTKSLSRLTQMTVDLPKRMEQEEKFEVRESGIHEVHALIRNFEAAAKTLKQMFQEAKKRNHLLTERTKELVESQKQLEYLARYDELTGLLNRRTFQEDIEQLLLDSKQHDEEFAVVYMDLDQFKDINDSLGHGAGDELLIIFAHRLQAFMNQVDQHKMKAYRLGGDEFILMIKNTDLLQTQGWCTQLVDAMREPMILFDNSYTISMSMGVSLFPADGDNVEKMIKNADSAMYRVKKSGKNGIQFFNDEDDSR